MKNITNFLDGKKTYICIGLLLALFVLDSSGLIPPDFQQYKKELYGLLFAGAGISLRLGMKKDTEKIKNEIEKAVKIQKGGV